MQPIFNLEAIIMAQKLSQFCDFFCRIAPSSKTLREHCLETQTTQTELIMHFHKLQRNIKQLTMVLNMIKEVKHLLLMLFFCFL